MGDAQELEEVEQEGLVPYAPDFTPTTLGRSIGEDNVLLWLLDRAKGAANKSELLTAIAETCLSHISGEKDRRDMASHVCQGLQNYLLVAFDDNGAPRLTSDGERVLASPADQRDAMFAQHILTRCNGYRLVEAIERFALRGQIPNMELLTDELDRSATSKNLSTMKAWLVRAGVMRDVKRYEVNDSRLQDVIGPGAKRLVGLDDAQVEFLLAARILRAEQSSPILQAPDIKLLAELRTPGVKFPSKALGQFVRRMVDSDLFRDAGMARAAGGTRVAVELTELGFDLSDEQVRGLVKQCGVGMPLSELLSLEAVVATLGDGTAESVGRVGEMLAVHACLMLGFRVVRWRARSASEIDLIAERVVALGYQRWHIQVKNIRDELTADRVDREVGVAAGSGATHILFVVPRAEASRAARLEMSQKNRLTGLHIFALTATAFERPVLPANLLRELRKQEAYVAHLKRIEAERRDLA